MALIDVVFEHDDFIVVNKPAGIAVHAHDTITLLEQVRAYLCSDQVHPVHRLDLGTSGLLVFAKTAEANRWFCDAFAKQQVQKIYLALSPSKPKQKQGWIKGDMEKARGGSFKLCKSQQNPAITYALSLGQQASGGVLLPRLWVLRPLTGKTHQLRVALKSFGAPILGDERYGGMASDRLYLHAYAKRFCYRGEFFSFKTLPASGEHFVSAAFTERLAECSDPWALAWPSAIAAPEGFA